MGNLRSAGREVLRKRLEVAKLRGRARMHLIGEIRPLGCCRRAPYDLIPASEAVG